MGSITLKDVAKVAGVSYATVSRALSGSPEIGVETRNRILKLCQEMGYTPNSVARSMVMKRTNIIGLIVPSINNPFMSELTTHIEIHSRRRGYNLMVCNSSYDLTLEKQVFSLLLGRQVDGIIMIPAGNESYEALKNLILQVPTVFISENMQDLPENYVAVDNRQGTESATKYLYSLGHRRILYFGCRTHSITHRLRLEGYLTACEKLGLTPSVVHSTFERSSQDAGYMLANRYFSTANDCTAILCASDTLAIGCMQAAIEHGYSIPQDLSIIGFDNISFAALPQINLTSVDQPKEQMAVSAVDLLIDRIQHPDLPISRLILPTELVKRESCRLINSTNK